jgi:hypothetical protein
MPERNTIQIGANGSEEPEESPLASAMRNFSANLSALREFVAFVSPVLDKESKGLFKKHMKDLVPVLMALHVLEPEKYEMTAEVKGKFTALYEGELSVTKNEDGGCSIVGISPERLLAAMNTLQSSHGHQVLLYRSALISLVSAAEWFLSQVIRYHFNTYPDAAGIEEKTVTLRDLKDFASIEDAQRHLLDLRVNEIMWGGFEDWIKILKSTLKLSCGYLEGKRDSLVEVFQRRNVMVHNNGRVHTSYLQKVEPKLRTGIALGQALPVSPEYLESAIDLVELNFILFCAELWKKSEPTDEERSGVMTDIAFKRLTEERWTVAEGISLFCKADKRVSERGQLVAQLNYWQSLKWQNRVEEVKSEIQAADFSAKDELFQIGRLALLEDASAFFAMLPSVLESNKLTRAHLKEWPIFRDIRKTQQYADFEATEKTEENIPEVVH